MRFFVKLDKKEEEERCEVKAINLSSRKGVAINIVRDGLTYTVMEFTSSGEIEVMLNPKNCYKVTNRINIRDFGPKRGI